MINNFFEKILNHKKELISQKKIFFNALKSKLENRKHSRYSLFKKAISRPGKINLIAEIKKASPSKGIIRKNFSVSGLARKYVEAQACALSILTEEKFFLGKPTYVKEVSEHFSIPVLAKDFFIDEVQVYEAFSQGASAILLIAAILNDKDLKSLMAISQSLDMDYIVEVHNKKELNRAIDAGAEIIGVNNRNLNDFTVDFKTCEKLIPQIPKNTIIVAESGIESNDQIKILKSLGTHAVLVGEILLRSYDIGLTIKELLNGKD